MTFRLAFALPLAIVFLTGCDDSMPPATPGVGSGSAPAAQPAPVAEAAKPAEPLKPRAILGQTTTEVRDAQKEIQSGAAVKAPPRRLSGNPITVAGNVYVSAIGQTAIGQIKHAMDLYQAGHDGQYPKTYEEFKQEILKPNGIALRTLPYYQECGYDAPTHELIILEYPH